MNRMKIGKTSGPSGVAIELFKAGGDKCLKSLTNIFTDVLFKDKLLVAIVTISYYKLLSSLLSILKRKRIPLIQTHIVE